MAEEKTLQDFIREAAGAGALAKQLQRGLTAEEKVKLAAIVDPEARARETLRTVQDPEMSVNIVDLGLVYAISATASAIRVKMTLTAPTCPVAELIPREAEARLREAFPGVADITAELVWEPPWSQEMMSDDARFILDMW